MKTILFADDDRNLRELLEVVFREEGYRVVLAEDGEQAIDVAIREKPDVAVLDVEMPKKSGLQLAEELHRIIPQLPVVLYTVNDDVCAHDNRTRHVSACVDKNSGFTELFLAVSRVLLHAAQNDALRIGLAPEPEEMPQTAGSPC
jgi:DNA-binding NtrC family response regulator